MFADNCNIATKNCFKRREPNQEIVLEQLFRMKIGMAALRWAKSANSKQIVAVVFCQSLYTNISPKQSRVVSTGYMLLVPAFWRVTSVLFLDWVSAE